VTLRVPAREGLFLAPAADEAAALLLPASLASDSEE